MTRLRTYRKTSQGETLIEIFLPANAETVLWDIQLGNWRSVPHPERLVLHYGSSSTQCAYMPTPSLAYLTIAAAKTGTDYVNRGIGSLFFDERTICGDDTCKPDTIFVRYGGNDLVQHDAHDRIVITDGIVQYCTVADVPILVEKAQAYLAKLRRIYPAARIILMSTPWSADTPSEERLAARRAYFAALRNVAGQMEITYVDGDPLNPHIPACYHTDGIHLNALGNALFALEFEKLIR